MHENISIHKELGSPIFISNQEKSHRFANMLYVWKHFLNLDSSSQVSLACVNLTKHNIDCYFLTIIIYSWYGIISISFIFTAEYYSVLYILLV